MLAPRTTHILCTALPVPPAICPSVLHTLLALHTAPGQARGVPRHSSPDICCFRGLSGCGGPLGPGEQRQRPSSHTVLQGLLLRELKCHTKTFSGKNIVHTPPAMNLQGCSTYMSLTLTLPVMTVMTMSSSSGGYTTSQCWQNDDSMSNLTQRGCEQNGPYPTHRP
ncbi:hypothetical protein DPX16_17468 [Anabarilius grahami]|uniref:Uncharacterized protein n=1 Tax=Anabarilius grahami TaxID=495550 RepID=A0A3N0XZ65_ANAGA|nr:hypothetical protein DPX16_17468 [Anabarilius grahami]